MSSPVQDTAAPNVVPESPPQTAQHRQQQHIWYPSPHQQHYTIVVGTRQPQQQYIIQEQQGMNSGETLSTASVTATTPTIQEVPMLSTISPLQTTPNNNSMEDDEDALLLLPLQRSPPNADHIFRPRPFRRSRRCNRETSRCNNEKASEDDSRQEHDETSSQRLNQESSSPWEPIPWSNIFLAAGNTMDEDEHETINAMETQTGNTTTASPQAVAHQPAARSRTPLLAPRLQREHFNSFQGTAGLTVPSLPLPPSPVVRRRYSMPARSANRKRKTYSPAVDVPQQQLPAPPASKRPRLTATPPPPSSSPSSAPLPSWWPQKEQDEEAPLLDHFWHYCTSCRPHLLPTLTSAVKQCQKEQEQPTDEKNTKPIKSLVKAIMDELVSAWGAPLFGEVRRQVLAQQQQQQLAESRSSKNPVPTTIQSRHVPTNKKDTRRSSSSPPLDISDMQLAVAYGFHLARLHQAENSNGRDMPPELWREAAQNLQSMSQRNRQRMWQKLTTDNGV